MTGTATRSSTYDVIVIGARCAGAAVALLLARQGLKVLVVDRSRHGSDTLSTHALMRGGVLQLQRWGILDAVQAAGTPSVSATTFHYGEESVEIFIKPRDGVDALYAPRRTVIDPILADAAVGAGAEILRGPRVTDLIRPDGDRVRGVIVEDTPGHFQQIGADMVIGADGVRSTVARLVNAPINREGRHATGVVYGYWEGLDLEGYHWYYRPGVAAGSIATNGGTLVFAAVSRERFWSEVRFDLPTGFFQVLREAAPEVVNAMSGARQLGGFRGFSGQPGFLRQCWGPGWALVGDAGYFKDPITAHGMTDAPRDAELLARAVLAATRGALAGYQRVRDDLSVRLFEMTDILAAFEWGFEDLQALHKELSDEMRQEVQYLVRLHDRQSAAATNAEGNGLVRAS
ncbi:MAG: NAD(P)/FAD-dependent oxidoreductase [Acidobacteriota bacterium]